MGIRISTANRTVVSLMGAKKYVVLVVAHWNLDKNGVINKLKDD
jgi:hypothetical protein